MTEEQTKLMDADLAYCNIFQDMNIVLRKLLQDKTLNTNKLKGRLTNIIGHPYKNEFYLKLENEGVVSRITISEKDLVSEIFNMK